MAYTLLVVSIVILLLKTKAINLATRERKWVSLTSIRIFPCGVAPRRVSGSGVEIDEVHDIQAHILSRHSQVGRLCPPFFPCCPTSYSGLLKGYSDLSFHHLW